jgi:hypothetical protein
MIHLMTGETISSYNKLTHNSMTVKMWQTAVEKDFGEGDGTRQQQDRPKKNKRYVCHDTCRDTTGVNELVKKSLIPMQWWTINSKRRMQVGFESQLGANRSTRMRSCWSPWWTLSQ